MRRWLRLLGGPQALAICLLTLSGCGESLPVGPASAPIAMAPNVAAQALQNDAGGRPVQAAAIQRKVVRTANLQFEVADFQLAAASLGQMVQQVQGYVANSNVEGESATARLGTWKIRVPIAAYDQFLKSVRSLGKLVLETSDSQDVTAEFYDLEARVKNKQQEEVRLLKHLTDSTGKLDDILNVEKEISRVRGEIEVLQGRRNVLEDTTAMTTVTIHLLSEIRPVPVATLPYIQRLTHTFAESVAALRWTVAEAFLAIVAFAPWAIFVGLPTLGIWALSRPKPRVHRLP